MSLGTTTKQPSPLSFVWTDSTHSFRSCVSSLDTLGTSGIWRQGGRRQRLTNYALRWSSTYLVLTPCSNVPKPWALNTCSRYRHYL